MFPTLAGNHHPMKPTPPPQLPNDGSASKRVWVDSNWGQSRAHNLLKLVKAPRVPQAAKFSIFSSSVNGGMRDADNQLWPPLGWRARVGQDDRLEASATEPRPS